MSPDKIIAEVWQHRDAYAAEHHHSLEEMVADLMRRQRAHAKRLVDRRSGKRSQSAASSACPDAAPQPAPVVAEGGLP
jgi:hypothetical protein